MRSLFIATASALFFAALITELFMRLWPDQYFALLVLAFLALLVSGLLNLRLAGWLRATAAPEPARRGRDERQPRRDPAERQGGARAANARPDKPANATRRAPAREPAVAEGPRETGTVKWFNRTKGFGFVIRESGEEIFVHQRSIRFTGEGDNRRRPALRDGQSVTFVVAEREKGLQAEDVVPVD